MKILYGIQCTGNGHITRSVAIIEELQKYARVDVLVSGLHRDVLLPFPVKYRCDGLSYFFGKNGGFAIGKTLLRNNPFRFFREIKGIPAHVYDMVISDFEPISAWSARRDWVYSIGISNQAALREVAVLKPTIFSPFSKLIIDYFCPVFKRYGLHYNKLNDSLYFPPIRQEILKSSVSNDGHYVVYLPFFSAQKIVKALTEIGGDTHWHVFSNDTKEPYTSGTIVVNPILDSEFVKSLASCAGVLCSASFSTTSEALYLGKKLMVIPMKSQYEQQCNAFSLGNAGVGVIKSLKTKQQKKISEWILSNDYPQLALVNETEQLVRNIVTDYVAYTNQQAIQRPSYS